MMGALLEQLSEPIVNSKGYKEKTTQKEEERKIIICEYFWANDKGCHYYLTPVTGGNLLSQFCTDSPTLKKARKLGQEWMEKMSRDLDIKIILDKHYYQ